MFRVVCAFLLCIPLFSAFSQPLPTFRYGLSAEAGLNRHNSSFNAIPGITTSPVPFDGGIGIGLSFGLIGDYQLSESCRVGLLAGYDQRGGTLSGDESTVFTVNGTPVAGTIRHSLTASLSSIIVRPTFTLISGNMEVGVGLSLSRIFNSDFEQKQEVIEPQGITLTAAPVNGNLPNAAAIAFAPSLSVGVRYPLGDITVVPTARAEYGLTDIAGLSWRAWSIRGGITFMYESRPVPPDTVSPEIIIPQPVIVQFDTLYVRDTLTSEMRGIPAERVILSARAIIPDTGARQITIKESFRREIPRPMPLLRARAGVAFVNADGAESANLRVEIRRTITKRFFPILPAVFFEGNSSELPDRYGNPPAESPLIRYYALLDTIARRLAASPQATLLLTAVIAGDSSEAADPARTIRQGSTEPLSASPSGEKQDRMRSFRATREMRAQNLKNVLLRRAVIAPEKIQIRTITEPLPSDPALREEAERVGLSSPDASILAPLTFYDTVENSNPPIVRFLPNIISDEGVETWRLMVYSGGVLVKEFAGKDEPPASIDWQLTNEKPLLHTRKPLTFSLVAVNFEGDTTISPTGEIRFASDTVSAVDEGEMFDALEYSIVFFDYNSSAIAPRDRATLGVLQHFCSVGRTDVTGMTDALGDEQYNRNLSRKRAEAVAGILRIKRSAAHGVGSAGAEFPNNLPEGRMFNRRVKVSIIR